MTKCLTCQIAATADATGNQGPTVRTVLAALDVAARDKLTDLLRIAELEHANRVLTERNIDLEDTMARINARYATKGRR